MRIKRAEPKSIDNINDLIRDSKAILNYPLDYLKASLPLLEIDESYLAENLAFEILTNLDKVVGFFAITEKRGDRYLDHLWVEPSMLRSGIGRLACHFVFQLAQKKGWKRLFVLPDPPSTGFYEKLGFENTGQLVSSRVPAGPDFFLYRKAFDSGSASDQMYNPPFFQEKRTEVILHLIQHNPLAIIISDGSQPFVSHLPITGRQNDRGEIELIGHMARNNPHWKALAIEGSCTTIFQGPQAYISPSWYSPKQTNVPTWNYAVVHVRSEFKLIEDSAVALSILNKQVEFLEAQYQTGWQLPSNLSSLEKLVDHIVSFKLTNPLFEAKFKLSQQQNLTDRANVIKELKDRGHEILAGYMESEFK